MNQNNQQPGSADPIAWAHEDGRVIPASTKAAAELAYFDAIDASVPARASLPDVAMPEQIETAAKAIYELLPTDRGCNAKTHPWQRGGNSMKQDEARRYARAALETLAAQPAEGSDTAEFLTTLEGAAKGAGDEWLAGFVRQHFGVSSRPAEGSALVATDEYERMKFRFFKHMTERERRNCLWVLSGLDESVIEEVRSHADELRIFNRIFRPARATPAAVVRAAPADRSKLEEIERALLRARIPDGGRLDAINEALNATQALLAAEGATQAGDSLTDAARDVLAERRRQVEQEGWTPAHDDKYNGCELATAAATYALCERPDQLKVCGVTAWAWPMHWWKPGTYRRNLVKAGALILAEIERLDRAGDKQGAQGGGK